MPLTQLLVDEIRGLRQGASSTARTGGMGRAIRLAERAAKSAVPVMIEGEPGSGADALARAIHDCSDRRGRTFVRVHAGDLGDAAVETLVGVDKGAGSRQTGKILDAQGGTILLQSVEELPLEAQGALLRAIRDGEIEPLGAKRSQKVDMRLIASANSASLMERVRQGRFREDLYYRLHVLPIMLPPLRARRDEIAGLAQRFLTHFAGEEGKRISGLSGGAVSLLTRYDWPGNLRQLENAVFRAVVLAEGCELTVAEFPQIAARVAGFGIEIPPVPAAGAFAALVAVQEMVRLEMRDPHALTLVDQEGEMRTLDDLEGEIIRFALAHYRGHMSAVSRRLGIGRSTLYRKLKELGLENEPADAAA
jgi:DNA-binding NtrC family response regulator